MEQSKIWLSSPHMGGGEMKYIQDAFDENWIAPLGPNVNGLEHDLEEFLNEDIYVAALSSGTAAIHLSLVLLDVKPGDLVICQSLTFSASANLRDNMLITATNTDIITKINDKMGAMLAKAPSSAVKNSANPMAFPRPLDQVSKKLPLPLPSIR